MDEVKKTLRNMVSRDKFRLVQGEFDLDLTYITDQIIAMGLPSDGIVSTWRNHIDEVSAFLNQNHSGHYIVYNLSEDHYDEAKFEQVKWFGWPDHNAPSFSHLLKIIQHMDEWCKKDPKNVCVVHCKAGRGRTGTVIAAYYVYINLFDDSEAALQFFAAKRSTTKEGVNSPSQKRYVHYVAISKPLQFQIPIIKKIIKRIRLKPVPDIPDFTPYVEIVNTKVVPFQPIFSTLNKIRKFEKIEFECIFDFDCIVQEDVLIRIYHQNSVFGIVTAMMVCRCAFHVSFLEGNTVLLKREQMEGEFSGPLKDTRFPMATFLEVTLSEYPPPLNRATKPVYFAEAIHSEEAPPPPIDRSTKPPYQASENEEYY